MKLFQRNEASAVALPNTGSTTLNTLLTRTIPAGALGPYGLIRVRTQWSMTGSTNQKNLVVKFGGTIFQNIVTTTAGHISAAGECVIRNRGALNSQISTPLISPAGYFLGTTAAVTAALDTNTDLDLLIQAQLADGTETITLQAWEIDVEYGQTPIE